MKSYKIEVVVEPKVNWDEISLVTNGACVILTDGHYTDHTFGGMIVNGEFIGVYQSNLIKEHFKPFQGEITLKS